MTENSLTGKGKDFERRVANLFSLLGYSVQMDLLVGGRQVDLRLEARNGPLSRIYIVECKNQAKPVTTAQYDSFRGRLMVAKSEISPKVRGIIVSSVGFVKEAKAQSERDEVELITISELETSVIDFRQYVRDLIHNLENDSTLAYFIEPNLRRENLTLPESAYSLIDKWLADPVANQMTLLGDYGTGKTTLLKHLALTMARRYQQEVLESGARGRVPIFIDLRDYIQAISLKQIILDYLDTHSIRTESYAAFEHVSREGQLLLILDGFDEMVSRGNYEVTLRNFRELNKTAIGKAKIILSCRTHYFTTQQDVQKFHGQPISNPFMPKSYTDLYREIATRQNFLITYLMEFEAEQVKQYLQQRCGERSLAVQSFIESTYNLTELSRRPVLLDMIVSSEGKISSREAPVTPGILYQVYTDIWLSLNDWSSIIDSSTKSDLLERFAHLVSLRTELQLHYRDILRLVMSWKHDIDELDAIEIDRELRTASFLVRDQEGNYKFSHKSFQEFFYARYLLTETTRGSYESWAKGFFPTEIYRFIRDLLPSMPNVQKALLEWLQDNKLSEYTQANAIKCLGGIQDDLVLTTLLDSLKNSNSNKVRACAAVAVSYYPNSNVVGTLIEISSLENDPFVFTNCLIALGRLNNKIGNGFLISILNNEHPRLTLEKKINLWPLYKAAIDFQDERIVEACIKQHILGKLKIIRVSEACLDLCRHRWSSVAENYCIELLKNTNSPKLAATAFGLLPNSKRLPCISKMLSLIDKFSKNLYSETLIKSLQGVSDSRVENHLCSIVDFSKSNENAITALEVLSVDYPATVVKNSPKWMRQKNRNYTFRIQVAKEYAKHVAPDGLQNLIDLFLVNDRSTILISILGLIYKYYPDSLGKVILQLWNQISAPIVKKCALEYLRKIDNEKAVCLMLERGLKDLRAGTRVGVCSILSAEVSEDVTTALLEVLHSDDSKWVRLQVLRSLCSPGRNVLKTDILAASESESDREVINLRKELLGV